MTAFKTVAAATLVFGASQAMVPAYAQEGEWSANFAVTSDYMFRGFSQSNSDLSLNGGFDYENGNFYAGTWFASIDFEDDSDANVEWDIYAGYAPSYGGFDFDIGFIYYAYPDADVDPQFDFFEVYGGVSTEVAENLSVGLNLAVSPEFFGETGTAVWLEGSAEYAINDAFAISAGVGQQSIDEGDDYVATNIGGTFSGGGFDFDVRYHDTDVDTELSDGRVVFTLSRSF